MIEIQEMRLIEVLKLSALCEALLPNKNLKRPDLGESFRSAPVSSKSDVTTSTHQGLEVSESLCEPLAEEKSKDDRSW